MVTNGLSCVQDEYNKVEVTLEQVLEQCPWTEEQVRYFMPIDYEWPEYGMGLIFDERDINYAESSFVFKLLSDKGREILESIESREDAESAIAEIVGFALLFDIRRIAEEDEFLVLSVGRENGIECDDISYDIVTQKSFATDGGEMSQTERVERIKELCVSHLRHLLEWLRQDLLYLQRKADCGNRVEEFDNALLYNISQSYPWLRQECERQVQRE